MKPARHLFALVLLCLASLSHAAFPDRPIKMRVGFPAGGPLDAQAGLLAERLGQVRIRPVIIDCKAGAGGTVGAEFVAKSPPDGYTLVMADTGTMVINPAVCTQPSDTTLKDFVPIARTAQQPLALVVSPAVPATAVQEPVALAKENPGKLDDGWGGNGGISHLVPEMFKTSTGIFIVHIPYRGSASAFSDPVRGQVPMMAESIPQASQHVKQGKLRTLAATGRERSAAPIDVPTCAQAAIESLEVVAFHGVLAPAGTPGGGVAKLSDAFRQVLETPRIRTRMVQRGADPAYLSADQITACLAAEMPDWFGAVKDSGTKLD